MTSKSSFLDALRTQTLSSANNEERVEGTLSSFKATVGILKTELLILAIASYSLVNQRHLIDKILAR